MTLEEARKKIDAIDPQLRTLLLERLECSYQVAQAKQADGTTDIYRADRESEILSRLGADFPEDRRAGYLSVVKKIMETSRMYQYGLLYQWNPGIFNTLQGSELLIGDSSVVTVELTRPNCPNSMSSILSMVGDYGYNMQRMELISTNTAEATVTFRLTILGNLMEEHMKTLMFQLSKESSGFQILSIT